MKVINEDSQMQTNISGMQTFQIEANATMFKILSADIYQDKIAAVIRELSTNAIDSMADAETLDSHRLYVHLPTVLEPHFSIRDYGTGLDDEGIKLVYTYGASNRRTSNNFNGAFGIGSKSQVIF